MKIDKVDFINIKKFCSLKTTALERMKIQAEIERKYLQYIYRTKYLYPEHMKILTTL